MHTSNKIRRDHDAGNGTGDSIPHHLAVVKLQCKGSGLLLQRLNVCTHRPQVSLKGLQNCLFKVLLDKMDNENALLTPISCNVLSLSLICACTLVKSAACCKSEQPSRPFMWEYPMIINNKKKGLKRYNQWWTPIQSFSARAALTCSVPSSQSP